MRPKPSGSRLEHGSNTNNCRLYWCRCVVALALIWLSPVVPAVAQQLDPAVIAVIDYQRILRDAKSAKSIRDQVEARRQSYQIQIADEEKRLHEADKDLAAQRSVLSAEAYAEKRRLFEEDVNGVQRSVQERRRQLDDVSAAALAEVRTAIINVVGELAEDRGFNVVLPSSGVLLFSPMIDLTEDVLANLDERLPIVKVPEDLSE